ncbi:MAG: zinc ribbon domain-containing protein, partial [Firmicutes bacterium]|nr:zinc ribbon domain-containing protein [Bacillota bacterium]
MAGTVFGMGMMGNIAAGMAAVPPPPAPQPNAGGKNFCPDCGTNIKGKKFCSGCGKAVGAGGCSACGAKMKPNAKFCAECGTKA